jgi:hypothetical protein
MDEIKNKQSCDSMGYSHQFVQNDSTTPNLGMSKFTIHNFSYNKILEGTVAGTIYRGHTAVQTLSFNMHGSVKLTDIGHPSIKVISGNIDHSRGILSLEWNKEPGTCNVIASYEYNMDATYKPKEKENNFIKPTFDKFFTSEELLNIARTAGTVCTWDFVNCLGDTIKEKYESLYAKCHELTAVLLRKGAAGYFWICCSPEVGSIFETACYGFAPVHCDKFSEDRQLGVSPMGLSEQRYRGSINMKWRLYTDTEIPENMLLIGCNDKIEDSSHYAKLMVANFII